MSFKTIACGFGGRFNRQTRREQSQTPCEECFKFCELRSKRYARQLYVYHRIRDLFLYYKNDLLFWLLFSGESVEIHSALSVHLSMARANDVKNSESQINVFVRYVSVVNRSNRDTTVYSGLLFFRILFTLFGEFEMT